MRDRPLRALTLGNEIVHCTIFSGVEKRDRPLRALTLVTFVGFGLIGICRNEGSPAQGIDTHRFHHTKR